MSTHRQKAAHSRKRHHPSRNKGRAGGKTSVAKAASRRAPSRRKWSAAVTRNSNALDLEPKVFTQAGPGAIARSLKRSAERSERRKTGAFQSAMSMLTFYINRAGRNLPETRLRVLERAKSELRRAFGRT